MFSSTALQLLCYCSHLSSEPTDLSPEWEAERTEWREFFQSNCWSDTVVSSSRIFFSAVIWTFAFSVFVLKSFCGKWVILWPTKGTLKEIYESIKSSDSLQRKKIGPETLSVKTLREIFQFFPVLTSAGQTEAPVLQKGCFFELVTNGFPLAWHTRLTNKTARYRQKTLDSTKGTQMTKRTLR